jgi:hypothetical protein
MLKNDLEMNNGIIVYFDTIKWRFYLPTVDELTSLIPLIIVQKYPDGTIYKLGGQPP